MIRQHTILYIGPLKFQHTDIDVHDAISSPMMNTNTEMQTKHARYT